MNENATVYKWRKSSFDVCKVWINKNVSLVLQKDIANCKKNIVSYKGDIVNNKDGDLHFSACLLSPVGQMLPSELCFV